MFNMLFVLNIDKLIINYINLKDQINKRFMRVLSCRITQLLIRFCLNLLILTRLSFMSCFS